jgi:hypothetical protein
MKIDKQRLYLILLCVLLLVTLANLWFFRRRFGL